MLFLFQYWKSLIVAPYSSYGHYKSPLSAKPASLFDDLTLVSVLEVADRGAVSFVRTLRQHGTTGTQPVPDRDL